MKQFVSFPKIKRFNNFVKNFVHHVQYIGENEKGEAQFDYTKKLPIIDVEVTVKTHGSQGAVSYNNINTNDLYPQSRTRIITVQKDNAGFALFVKQKESEFNNLFKYISFKNKINTTQNTITIFGEWIGPGIQKGMGINKLKERSFIIFAVKVKPLDKEQISYWLDEKYIKSEDKRIYNINDFSKYSLQIDFNKPNLIKKEMDDLMLDIEEECPVAKQFGFKGIGEGFVARFEYENDRYYFKHKGEKHQRRTKKIKIPKNKPSSEEIEKIFDLVVSLCNSGRLQQQYDLVLNILSTNPVQDPITKTGDFIKAMIKDIFDEEEDIIVESGLNIKNIKNTIAKLSKQWFFEELNK